MLNLERILGASPHFRLQTMKNLLVASLFALCATSALAEDYQPFVVIDSSSEKDKLANEYIAANITLGVKGPNKFEYSIKSFL